LKKYQLLKELKQNDKPFISIQEIYTRIAPIISNNSQQTPLCRPIQNTGDQGGEFVFVAAVKRDITIGDESTSAFSKYQKVILEMDLDFWENIQNSDDPDEYEAYLEEFPDGKFASLARIRLKKLTQRKEIASITPADTKPKPASEISKARLFVETKPENARIRILNIKPKFHQGIELNPGSYHIEVAAKGYTRTKKWIKINTGEERRMSIELAKTPATGTLNVSGSPYGANVYLAGNYKGKMPILVDNVTPGSHQIRVRAEDYIEKSDRISIDPRENKTLRVNLKKKIVARDGRFEKLASGVVRDTRSDLEWYAGPGEDTNWGEAKRCG
jgi:hypothetical protein